MKLWGARFRKEENKLMEEFNKSFDYDHILYKKDIEGSIAHVYMLVHCNLLTEEEGITIIDGLNSIQDDIYNKEIKLEGNYEDIHSFIEINLIQRVGDVGKKLHIARSRNDQVATDMKLYAKEKTISIIKLISSLKKTIKIIADKNCVIMHIFKELK